MFLIALIPATMLVIAGYFALYLSHRSEGALRSFGRYLGFWAITLAGLVVLGSLFATAYLGRGGMMRLHERHMPMRGHWQGEPAFFRELPGEPGDGPPPGPESPPIPPPPPEAAPPSR
jgi:hypothetical protein